MNKKDVLIRKNTYKNSEGSPGGEWIDAKVGKPLLQSFPFFYKPTTASISTKASLGRFETSTVALAGL